MTWAPHTWHECSQKSHTNGTAIALRELVGIEDWLPISTQQRTAPPTSPMTPRPIRVAGPTRVRSSLSSLLNMLVARSSSRTAALELYQPNLPASIRPNCEGSAARSFRGATRHLQSQGDYGHLLDWHPLVVEREWHFLVDHGVSDVEPNPTKCKACPNGLRRRIHGWPVGPEPPNART